MKNKIVRYYIQTNLDGGFDVIQNTSKRKIVAHTDNEDAAKAIINFITKGNNEL